VSTLAKPKFVEGVKDARSNNIWQSVYQLKQVSANMMALVSQIHVTPIHVELEPSVKMTLEMQSALVPLAKQEIH
jgi:hypothetical protein